MSKNELSYTYDPVNERLTITDGGRNMGGFVGRMATKQWLKLLQQGKDITLKDMDREPERKQKVKRLRALWIAQGIDNYREAIMEPYGVTSTADLTLDQLDGLIGIYTSEAQKPVTETTRKLRSQVLTLLQKLGVYATNDDWHSVNRYLINPRIAGKLLYQMNDNEMKALTRKLRAIIAKEREKLEYELKLSMMN
jgi:hypothetical protein